MLSENAVKCTDCGEKTAMLIHFDKFPCRCGENVTVKYFGCTCGFSWRTSDDIFVDGMKIDVGAINEIMEGSDDFFDGLDKLHGMPIDVEQNYIPSKFRNMSDMIHKCIKCGQVAIEKNDGEYECTDTVCGFTWEVDGFDGK